MIFNAVEPDFRFHGISRSAFPPILSGRPPKGTQPQANVRSPGLTGPAR